MNLMFTRVIDNNTIFSVEWDASREGDWRWLFSSRWFVVRCDDETLFMIFQSLSDKSSRGDDIAPKTMTVWNEGGEKLGVFKGLA